MVDKQAIMDQINKDYGFLTFQDVYDLCEWSVESGASQGERIPASHLKVLVRHSAGRFVCSLAEFEERVNELVRKFEYIRDISIPVSYGKQWAWQSMGFVSPFA